MRVRLPLFGVLIAALGAVVTACASATPVPAGADTVAAEETLSSFLSMLSAGDYAQAAALYAGPLDSLQAWNPEIDAQDVGGLIGYGCESRLLQCLSVRSIALVETPPGEEMVFSVEFSLSDGTLFVRGPCCGATSTEMPDQSTFTFRVQPKAGGGYAVLDLPPYVP
ncbi:MAG: hypothetical protein NTU91_06160 [Chloroflexi bacterium]|jgi:hypothetical protein|nr:hypothetical protein [Chloroflexota bacterium]